MKTNARFSAKAQGNSMYPLLRNGDTVEYVQTPFSQICLNDIVLMYVGDILITHRVIYKTKNTCITRGDNNASADPVIQRGRVLAQVVRFKRKGTWHDIQDVYLTQSAFYLHEIQKLETLLRLQKIPHVFLKGVLISLRYEGSIPKRIYADCDVLIERTNFKKVEKIFFQLAYQKIRQWNVSDKIIPEVNFTKKISGVPVTFDLHFEPHFLSGILGNGVNLLYPFSQRKKLTREIVMTARNIKIHSTTFSLPNSSMQIICLALHIFHHNFTDSVRYQLLDAVIRKSATKKVWNDVQNTVTEYHLEGYLYLVFIILRKYFKTPVPQSFITAIRPSLSKRKVSSHFFKRVDIFSQDNRVKAGIERFILIFLLSPEPLAKKLFLFIHPEVLHTGFKLASSFLISRVSQARRQVIKR